MTLVAAGCKHRTGCAVRKAGYPARRASEATASGVALAIAARALRAALKATRGHRATTGTTFASVATESPVTSTLAARGALRTRPSVGFRL